MDIDQVQRFFEDNRLYLQGNLEIAARAALVASLLRGRDVGRLLDVGCGDGSLSLPLLHRAQAATFLDFSHSMVAAVSKNLAGTGWENRARLIADRFETVAFAGETFDTVLCVGVLAHVESVEGVVEKLSSLVRVGGRVVVQFTDVTAPYYAAQQGLRALGGLFGQRPRYRVNAVTPGRMRALAARLGWREAAACRYAAPLPGLRFVVPRAWLYRMMVGKTGEGSVFSRYGAERLVVYEKKDASCANA